MKLTKTKLKQLVLEVLKDSPIVEAEQQKKPTYTIAKRFQRYLKAMGQPPNFKLSDDEIYAQRKKNPKFKETSTRFFRTVQKWEQSGMPDLSKDKNPQGQQGKQTSTTKGPGVDAKSTTTQSGKTKTTTTTGTVSSANSEDLRKWGNALGAMAAAAARQKRGNQNLARSGVMDTVRQLAARGWDPATGMAGIKKGFPQVYNSLIRKTGWTPEKMQKLTGSP
jgi:hypothetical protein